MRACMSWRRMSLKVMYAILRCVQLLLKHLFSLQNQSRVVRGSTAQCLAPTSEANTALTLSPRRDLPLFEWGLTVLTRTLRWRFFHASIQWSLCHRIEHFDLVKRLPKSRYQIRSLRITVRDSHWPTQPSSLCSSL